MSDALDLESQSEGSADDLPGRRQLEEQMRPASMASPGGYGTGHASRGGSRDEDAFHDSSDGYKIKLMRRRGAQPRMEYEAQSMGPPHQPGGLMLGQAMDIPLSQEDSRLSRILHGAVTFEMSPVPCKGARAANYRQDGESAEQVRRAPQAAKRRLCMG